jgi:hypothetical protein
MQAARRANKVDETGRIGVDGRGADVDVLPVVGREQREWSWKSAALDRAKAHRVARTGKQEKPAEERETDERVAQTTSLAGTISHDGSPSHSHRMRVHGLVERHAGSMPSGSRGTSP